MQESVAMLMFNARGYWELEKTLITRQGPRRSGLSMGIIQRQTWPSQNGFITFVVMASATGAKTNQALVKWMDEEGMDDDFLRSIDWDSFDMATSTQEFHDQVETRLSEFFLKHNSPVHYLAGEFLEAADKNDLDWRLLPTIAIVESGVGRTQTKNNVFGWDSGRQGFPSVRAGIHTVASRLANSKLYKGKDLNGILRTYNRRKTYSSTVLALIKTLGPAEIPAGGSFNRPVDYSSIRTLK